MHPCLHPWLEVIVGNSKYELCCQSELLKLMMIAVVLCNPHDIVFGKTLHDLPTSIQSSNQPQPLVELKCKQLHNELPVRGRSWWCWAMCGLTVTSNSLLLSSALYSPLSVLPVLVFFVFCSQLVSLLSYCHHFGFLHVEFQSVGRESFSN